ncbi:MAG: hypothetical protein M3R67_02455 [Acidobacteriota bacterium]|nr:hypothetical protein [Acidobacteriota bacterium]
MATKKSATTKKTGTKKAGTKKAGTKKAGTKKAGTRKAPATLNSILNFKIDWIKDPVPIFRRFLNPEVLRELELAKQEFKDRVNGILGRAR